MAQPVIRPETRSGAFFASCCWGLSRRLCPPREGEGGFAWLLLGPRSPHVRRRTRAAVARNALRCRFTGREATPRQRVVTCGARSAPQPLCSQTPHLRVSSLPAHRDCCQGSPVTDASQKNKEGGPSGTGGAGAAAAAGLGPLLLLCYLGCMTPSVYTSAFRVSLT